ncbi:MAG: O-methyltransferase [Tannerella sp.]|jgi:predicted O-methyltransferase YrrM|nr:O-methyltransferase [Tannerella sp.]
MIESVNQTQIDDYILQHIDEEGELLSALNRDAHVRLLYPRMIAGHLQGRLLKMFCRMMRPKRVLEIGTYTGYATICIAEGLDENALVYTVEINDEMQPFTMPYIENSPHRKKIRLFWGDVMDLLPTFDEQFDMVYIDGDKRDYIRYYDTVFPLLSSGALILADNTLWSGKVAANIPPADRQTQGILQFNEHIRLDRRVEKVIIPLRDGLTMIWKK